ncbi:MAG: zinc ribbon domain-containing protein [Candidatus Aminicenantes bacterium]|nr:zinc ribbon domain-containing protein [Candidatus Aminicenantes bacterium]
MPLYEFECLKCRKKFESLVALGKEKDVRCPQCKSSDIQKCFSSFGIGGGSSRLSSDTSCPTCSATSCSTCK